MNNGICVWYVEYNVPCSETPRGNINLELFPFRPSRRSVTPSLLRFRDCSSRTSRKFSGVSLFCDTGIGVCCLRCAFESSCGRVLRPKEPTSSMFEGIGGLLGGSEGNKPSTGFGQWYSDMQESKETEMSDLETGEGDADGSGAWRFWNGSEKKTDGASHSLLAGFLPGRQENTQTEVDTIVMGLSYQQRFKGFVLALIFSVILFALAFFIGLPTILLRPHKFAFSFTMGSLCFMASFAMLKGPTRHLRSMLARDRLPFSLAYVGSMVGTLYACLVLQSYPLVVICSAVQLLALAWYFLSFVPGGSHGMKYFFGAICKTVQYAIQPCAELCTRTFCFCLRQAG